MGKINIKIPLSGSFSGPTIKQETPSAASPPPFASLPPRLESPGASSSGTPSALARPKLKIKRSLPATPIDGVPPPLGGLAMAPPPVPTISEPQPQPPPVMSKAGRIMKPTAKKRASGEMDGDETEDEIPSVQRPRIVTNGLPQAKRIKFLQTPVTPGAPKTPAIRIHKQASQHRAIPHRPDGDGYDSEAEDREIDSVIEDQFILRMMPGEHCDYLRRCIQERKIGLPKAQGGADVAFRWLDEEMRRCMVSIQGTHYAAVLVDLPTVTEGMKTWDKKSFVKSADICQMLMVFAKVADDQEARTVSLPKAVEHGYRWPHGLTPPMHDCIHRRFRKRLSKLEIQNKEAEVERLLQADKDAQDSRYEWIDERRTDDEDLYYEDEDEEMEEDGEADAEGEAEEDYFGDADGTQQHFEHEEEELEVDEDLEAMFEEDEPEDQGEGVTPGPADGVEASTPMTVSGATPAAQPEAEDEGESEEESEEGEGDEFGYMEEGDEDEDGEHDQKASVRNEIASLEKQKAGYQEQLRQSTSMIMKKRLEQNIRNTDAEIQLKKRSIGEVEDED
ncbi:TAFII55 protein conserved region-domain-containing protein [Coniochaeta sp. 2T2.1]|nr:TAFII55 protein conserved region-domain-containing protein [Coniochaeta sp. 2T2.1]